MIARFIGVAALFVGTASQQEGFYLEDCHSQERGTALVNILENKNAHVHLRGEGRYMSFTFPYEVRDGASIASARPGFNNTEDYPALLMNFSLIYNEADQTITMAPHGIVLKYCGKQQPDAPPRSLADPVLYLLYQSSPPHYARFRAYASGSTRWFANFNYEVGATDAYPHRSRVTFGGPYQAHDGKIFFENKYISLALVLEAKEPETILVTPVTCLTGEPFTMTPPV